MKQSHWENWGQYLAVFAASMVFMGVVFHGIGSPSQAGWISLMLGAQ